MPGVETCTNVIPFRLQQNYGPQFFHKITFFLYSNFVTLFCVTNLCPSFEILFIHLQRNKNTLHVFKTLLNHCTKGTNFLNVLKHELGSHSTLRLATLSQLNTSWFQLHTTFRRIKCHAPHITYTIMQQKIRR